MIVLYGKTRDEATELAADFTMLYGKKITCRIGVAEAREGDSFEDIFNRMDKALYSAKSAGRNKVMAG